MPTQFPSHPRTGLHDQHTAPDLHPALERQRFPLPSLAPGQPESAASDSTPVLGRHTLLGRHTRPQAARALTQGQRVSLGTQTVSCPQSARQAAPRSSTPQVLCAAAVLGGAVLGSANAAVHLVRPGDTLWALARVHNTSVQAIRQNNGLKSDTIWVGMRLSLSGARANPPRSAYAQAVYRTQASSRTVQKQALFNQLERLEQNRGLNHGRVRAVSSRYVGIRYRMGGTGRGGIDCSAFTMSVMRDLGVRVPRTSRAQYGVGHYVTRSSLRAGDLVFFNTMGRGVSHAGIYLGGGLMANANSYQGRVVVENMNTAYWGPRFLGGRRVL